MKEMHEFFEENSRYPNSTEINIFIDKETADSKLMLEIIKDIDAFFYSVRPKELKQNIFQCLLKILFIQP